MATQLIKNVDKVGYFLEGKVVNTIVTIQSKKKIGELSLESTIKRADLIRELSASR